MGEGGVYFSPEGWKRKEELRHHLKEISIATLEQNPAAGVEVFSAFIEVSLDLLVSVVPEKRDQISLIDHLKLVILNNDSSRPRS